MPEKQISVKEQNKETAKILLAKSVPVAFLLSFFFGPLGMLYANVKGAIIMLIASVVIGALTLGGGLLLIWPITVIWATVSAMNFNKELLAKEGLQD